MFNKNPFSDSSIIANMVNSFINGTKEDVEKMKVTVHKLEMQSLITKIDSNTVAQLSARVERLDKLVRALGEKIDKMVRISK